MAQPGEKPLSFVSSIPANGATNVARNIGTITLVFDKNVVDDSVWEDNKTQIDFWAGSDRLEKRIDYNVVRSTATAKRRNIYIKPIGLLNANTKYTIRIGPNRNQKQAKAWVKVLSSFTTGRKGVVQHQLKNKVSGFPKTP